MEVADRTLGGELVPTPGFTFPQYRPFPIFVRPSEEPTPPAQASAVIFLHGIRECGADYIEFIRSFQKRLPHTIWGLPTANRHAWTPDQGRAWYGPVSILPKRPPNPEDEMDDDWLSIEPSSQQIFDIVDYLETHYGIPPERIALGGFCQGGALALSIGLSSSLAGRFAGIFSLMGYLPMRRHIDSIREHNAPGASVADQPVLIGRATCDQVVPHWYTKACLETLSEMRVRNVRQFRFRGRHRLDRMAYWIHLHDFLQHTCRFS